MSTSDNGTIGLQPLGTGNVGTPSLSLEVLDQAGNRGSPYFDNFSHITLDTSPPTLTAEFCLEQPAGQFFHLRKSPGQPDFKFQFQEPVQHPVVSIAGDNQSLQLTHNSDNTSWIAVYTVQPGDNGSASFRIDYQDLAGNLVLLLIIKVILRFQEWSIRSPWTRKHRH